MWIEVQRERGNSSATALDAVPFFAFLASVFPHCSLRQLIVFDLVSDVLDILNHPF